MPAVTYPEGISPELAARLYGRVKVGWASDPFAYDETRSECRFWLNEAAATGKYPPLVSVIRRGDNPDDPDAVRVFQWGDGSIFEQET